MFSVLLLDAQISVPATNLLLIFLLCNSKDEFLLEKENKNWLENFEKVKEIKEKFDRWLNARKEAEEGQLYGWLNIQRSSFKESNLANWKIEKLDALGV